MMVPLLGALFLVLVLLSFWRLAKAKAESRPKYPRSLPSLPIIGSLLHLGGNPQLHLLFHSLQKKYGSLYSLKMGSHYMVVVNHYLHAKEVLLKKGKTFAGRPHAVTTDMLTRDGKDIAFASYSLLWKFQRKQVHTALSMFRKGTLALEKIICREAASLCETLSTSQDPLLDTALEFNRAITNVMCSLCFSFCYRRGDPEFEAMLQYSQGIVDTVAQESLVDIFPWLQVFPNKDLALLKRCVEVRDQLLQKQFKKHKEALGSDSTNDLMDVLLRAQLNMENNNSRLAQPLELTDDHLLMTVGDIFGAGVETTSTTLKWAVLYLLHYPEVQRKIQEELDQKIGFERHPQLSDRQQLPYLEATISEVLRIRPVSPLLIPHVALTEASIGEYTIPKGAQVIINLWSLHHDEKEWDKPGEFNPGRFLDERGNRLYSPSPSYLPFGAGIRVCLGEGLAKMELFLFLAWILQRFTLEALPGQPLPALEGKFGVVLQVQPFKVKARLRAAWRDGV
ncbi:steroid 17-alpha-hydroxylase/17,20 lyase [Chelonoidis abingdonii]|uniref:Steroid 17-alpha-hydroxylase/17,20 lyase n=1 Tax=Chelonoidis abingdonii TaxID=106734 RepID=A0A8C0H9A9_CHEAB|nr:steroid 17-alpha-hydroxylase/17,20 lyase isoform X1 [Chelonoidis abingdonii]